MRFCPPRSGRDGDPSAGTAVAQCAATHRVNTAGIKKHVRGRKDAIMNYKNISLKVVSAAAGFVGILATASQPALAFTFNFNSLSDSTFNSVFEPSTMILFGIGLIGLRVFLSARAKKMQPLSVKAN